jgi:nitric oxide dioxygenase
LSDAPNSEYYRISIKREAGERPGLISNLMHDTVNVGDIIKLSAPRGDFWVDSKTEHPDSPLVLISGGVGLTCLNSIMKSVSEFDPARPISWIHAARYSGVRAFANSVLEEAKKRDNLQVTFFNAKVDPSDKIGVDYHHEGFVDFNKLDRDQHLSLGNPNAQYFVCGPLSFMLGIDKALQAEGVALEQIHMELFGTGGVTR